MFWSLRSSQGFQTNVSMYTKKMLFFTLTYFRNIKDIVRMYSVRGYKPVLQKVAWLPPLVVILKLFSAQCQTSSPQNISMVTLFNNHGTTAHMQRVMKYIPSTPCKTQHQTVPASSTPLRIQFETENRTEVWLMKSHASHLKRKKRFLWWMLF